MKKYYFILLSALFILGSCSTGNFAKRKYTKGKYKPERGDYNLAKSDKKKEDTKYVAQSGKQEQTVTNNKTLKTKKSDKKVIPSNEIAEVEVQNQKEEISIIEVKETKEVLLEDNVIIDNNKEEETEIQAETNEAANPNPNPAPSLAGDILGYIGFGLGILGLFFVILGAFIPGAGGLFWAGFAFALIALGVSIASWVIDGQSMWNLVGVITSSIAIAFAIIWLIILAIAI